MAVMIPVDADKRRRAFEVVRYLIVGGWNTAFGYGVFAALTYLFTGVIPYPYMVANAVASVLSITVAFLGYKLFVFKTKGNYLREYLRTWVVYGASTLSGLALLPVMVMLVGLVIKNAAIVPYVAQAVLTPIVVASSFLGHKKYSFRR
jgi:putative flippase GtrA